MAYKVDVAKIHIVEVRRRIKAPRPPPEVVDSGFAEKISPRFPVSPTDLQSRQQPTFTDSLALYTFLEVSGPLDLTFETRAILQVDSPMGHVFPSPVHLIAGFHCHAIKIKIENHSLNEVKKLTRYRP